jgi:hypothetical protein
VASPIITPDSPDSPDARGDSSAIVRWARTALSLALIPLSWHAFHDQYGEVPLLSGIDLAIHEFGHIFFMPFGIPFLDRPMVIFGASLQQPTVPLIFVLYFLRNRDGARDVHAAMVCLWWTSINVLSVAIYCNDARAGVLMLIDGSTGQESEGHDWNNLLRIWGLLNKDTVIARGMRGVAWLLCVGSIVAGLIAAWNSGRPRESAGSSAADGTQTP